MKTGRDIWAIPRRRPTRMALAPVPHALLDTASRAAVLASAQAAALADPAFGAHFARGDQARDAKDWALAESAYAAALGLYPYEASYWTQLGHMAKEQDRLTVAEIAYRTACALGAPPHDVVEHLRFVLGRQGIAEHRFPIRFPEPGPQAQQVPGRPDVIAFARLLWGVRTLDDGDLCDLLRRCGSLDALVAAMIRDPRFERANRDWLELVQEAEL